MPSKISRRRLGMAALGSAAFAQDSGPTYTGALDGFESKVDLGSFDPVLYTLRRYETSPLRLTFNAPNRKQAEAWQHRLRPKVAELQAYRDRVRSSVVGSLEGKSGEGR